MQHFTRFVVLIAIVTATRLALAQSCLNNIPPTGSAWSIVGDEAFDTSTGLVWKRCPEGQSWSGSACSGTAQTLAWSDALGLANAKTSGGWRLPNAKELHSMVDAACTVSTDPAADRIAFPGHPTSTFWSSTSGWAVNFTDGSLVFGQAATTLMNVRLVRGGNAQNDYAAGQGADASCDMSIPGDRPTSALLENADGTVTDASTGLTWARCAVGMSWSGGRCINPAATLDWQGALGAAASAGADWRLPSAKELGSLADQRCALPAINGQKFPDTPAALFWSSTSGWAVNFTEGSLAAGKAATTTMNARLVRGGNALGNYGAGHGADTNCDMSIPGDRPTGALLANPDGSVTDSSTGLSWARCAVGMSWTGARCINAASSMNWQGALAAATIAGSGWRLPNAKELASLVDQRCALPALDGQIFPDQPVAQFWSSSPGWAVNFADGSLASGQAATTLMNAHLVRAGNADAEYRGGSNAGRCTSDIPADFKRGNWLVYANGTANDRSVGLVWDRCLQGQTWDGAACTGTPTTYTWPAALLLAKAATSYGQVGWRLPNLKELDSITDRRCSDPALHPEVFRTPPSSSWTATPGWAVNSADGSVLSGQAVGSAFTVRLVREGGAPAVLLPPVLSAPGYASAPGPILATLTPTFNWGSVAGASGYGLFIRDVLSNTLVYPNAAGNTATPLTGNALTLPAGYLQAGRQYKWNMTSFADGSEFVPETGTNPSLWFQTSSNAAAAAFALTTATPYCDLSQTPPVPAVQLTWSSAGVVSSYRMHRNGTPIGASMAGNQFTFDNILGLTAGVRYSYRVAAVTGSGVTNSNTLSVTIPSTVCANAALGTAITGDVRSGPTAIAGVTLTASGANTGSKITLTDGRYVFDHVNQGTTIVTPSRTGFSFDPAYSTANLTGPIQLQQNFRACEIGRSFTGIVKDAANVAVVGATVTVGGRPAVTTVSGGSFTVAGLACSKTTISVIAAGYTSYRSPVDPFESWSNNVTLNKPSSDFGINTPAGKAADPVNTATGNYIYQHKDLQLPGIGMPFVFQRNYNSQDISNGPLGYGWSHSLNTSLAVDANTGNIELRGADGKSAVYAPDGQGGFTSQYGVFDTLSLNGDGTYTITQVDQSVYRFNAAKMLATVTDRNGNVMTFVYTSGNLTRVVDSAARNIDFTLDGVSRITAITDPLGRVTKFDYDGAGNLVQATDAKGNITQYSYDVDHQMLTAIDPRGNRVVSNTYDNSVPKRVVTSQRDAKGGQTDYVYDPVSHITVFTDALGNATTHYHDDKNRLIQEDDARGNSAFYVYDPALGTRTGVTDKNGNVISYTYDLKGNVTGKTDPLGAVSVITYDIKNNPLTRTDALAGVTSFTYDANGNLTQTTDALGNTAGVTYQTNGLPLTLTDARGNTSTNTYDAQGNITGVANALGQSTTLTYDAVGRKLTKKDALRRITTYAYDAIDNLSSVTDPTGQVARATFDGNSNRLSDTDRLAHTTQYTYDVKDLLATSTDALAGVVTNTYDGNDHKTSVTDKLGNVARFAYDAVGNLVSSTDPLGNISLSTFDANGNRLTVTDPLGQVSTFAFDALNRQVAATDALGNSSATTYDLLGRVLMSTNAKGQAIAFAYDKLGHLLTVTDANNATVTYTYDANGNRLSMTDQKGSTTTYAYDVLNRLSSKTEALGNITRYQYDAVGNRSQVTQADASVINYAYDALDRLSSVTYPDAASVTLSYDANGNRTKMVDSLGTFTYQYDALNRQTGFADAFGKTVLYGYDAGGNRTTLTYPDGKVVGYVYDTLSRLSSVTDWLTHTTSYTYDAAGRLTGSVNPNGTSASNSYDTTNRLTGISNKFGSTVQSSYAFTLDALGNHSSATVLQPVLPNLISGTVTNTYDTENRLTSSGGTVSSFDANGNLLTQGADSLVWDFENRLKQSTLAGATVQYQYDGLGNRFARTSGGVTQRYVLDPSSKLTKVLAETDAAGAITAYYVYGLGLVSRVLPDTSARYYQFDSRGSTVALTDASGAVTDSYAYEPFGKLANSQGTTANPYKFVGQFGVMDEGNGLNYIRARYYDPVAMRFISKDPKTGNDQDGQSLNRYAYALNNPVMFVDVNGHSALCVGVGVGAAAVVAASSGGIGLFAAADVFSGGFATCSVFEVGSKWADDLATRNEAAYQDTGATGKQNEGVDDGIAAMRETGSVFLPTVAAEMIATVPGTSLNSGLVGKGMDGIVSGLGGRVEQVSDIVDNLKSAYGVWRIGVDEYSQWRKSKTGAATSVPPNSRTDIPEIRDANAYKYQGFKK